MITPNVLIFGSESAFFLENLWSIKMSGELFNINNSLDWFLLVQSNTYNFSFNASPHTKTLVEFINQTEDLSFFDNFENISTVYHYSIPNVKLAYPEPFVASASLMHTDLWFMHILIYQYWLWFIFVFLIIFFFLTFICVVRWCNMRTRPRRETRGVSRSKCGDLITACVPVSWAASIIINESTDAIDFYDGFGTTELVVGIRAYQWGWEYYYPKDIDLNYNIKKNYASFIGNSLKYSKASDVSLKNNNFWKFYQSKESDASVAPAHLLLLTFDNFKLFNFLNFNDIGINTLQESNSFRKIKTFFKINHVHTINTYSMYYDNYKNISKLYLSDNSIYESYAYGTKRQHNFLNSSAVKVMPMSALNSKSVNKFLKFNNAIKSDANLLILNKSFINFNDNFSNYINKAVTSVNDIFLKHNVTNLSNVASVTDLKLLDDCIVSKTVNIEKINKFSNHFTVFKTNEQFLTSDKFIKKFVNQTLKVNNKNLFKNFLIFNDNFSSLENNINGLSYLYDFKKTNFSDLYTFNKLATNAFYNDYPSSPIISTNVKFSKINYDALSNVDIDNLPIALQGKEDSLPAYITSIYWNFYWNNTVNDIRFKDNLTYFAKNNLFYFPKFYLYYDYDFRNWQGLELLEDCFWETTYPNYVYEEYLTIFDEFYNADLSDQNLSYFVVNNRHFAHENKEINPSIDKNTTITGSFYSNFFYIDDFFTNVNLITTKNYNIFSNILFINNLDDSYESLKNLSKLFNLINKQNLNNLSPYYKLFHYTTIFNIFRSDYEDFNWVVDYNNYIFSNNNIFEKNNFTLVNALKNKPFLQFSNVITDLIDTNCNDFLFIKNARFNENLNLRNTVKSSIVTYNALQKVFKSRLDEGRSNVKTSELSNSYEKLPYLTTDRISYEKLLGKNKTNFYKTNFYKTNFYNTFNNYYNLTSSLNFFVFDFPFLLAYKSDSSKHFWFDWFAKWSFYEVQPSSSSRYAIHGVPYFNKFFDFTSNQNDILNEKETYLLRITKARKNYLANWTYTPYFYAKTNIWYKNNLFFENLNNLQNNKISLLKLNFELNNWYWVKSVIYFENNNPAFIPSISNINSYSKSLWRPFSQISSYYYNLSNLVDILTKREFMYRQLLITNNKLYALPLSLTNSPKNHFITEFKAIFNYNDPILYNNEYSKNIYYGSLAFFNFHLLKSFLISTNVFNSNQISNLFFYLFNDTKNVSLKNNLDLYKNQYRPLRKGVNNMLRLHATGAIAMPIEIRLQILASSKDVIHSWAIPSAGIKIDCVPGYSSHKVMIFLVSGIFWGQCMEICGRYHHWMPIVVYFMKRDLFFLWCTHFVFLSNPNNTLNINDKQYNDYVKFVSYDKNSWISELIK